MLNCGNTMNSISVGRTNGNKGEHYQSRRPYQTPTEFKHDPPLSIEKLCCLRCLKHLQTVSNSARFYLKRCLRCGCAAQPIGCG